MDFQLLVALLWRLRLAGLMSTSDGVRAAVDTFDREVPDLKLMRDVSQHLDEYAVDGPGHRHNLPGETKRVGRCRLEVPRWSDDRFEWLGGTINVAQARSAALRLYTVIREQRDAQSDQSS